MSGIQVAPVIRCGSSGKRWPLSFTGFPKHFPRLTEEESLFQQTGQRCWSLSASTGPRVDDSRPSLRAKRSNPITRCLSPNESLPRALQRVEGLIDTPVAAARNDRSVYERVSKNAIAYANVAAENLAYPKQSKYANAQKVT